MKLTDERIRFDAWFDSDDNGNYWYCFLDAYRMAEAEATKPCVCCEPSTPGVVHRTGGPCYVQEATKPQITGGETYPDSTEADKERLSLALDKIWGKKPQEPCPDYGTCDECGSPYSYDPRDDGSICVPCMMGKVESLQTKCAELESDVESLTEENDSRLETSIKQHARIMALEAEVERLNKVIAGYERDQGKIIFEQGDQAKTIAQQVERIKELEAEVERKMSAGQFLAEKIKELETMSVGNKEGMALVTKEDAENYCRILSLLGMEEEGSPVEDIERLISLRDGMTCGDCNDTGWLENREEERYPCTCMTEAEPYQLLEVERDDWKSRYESSLSVNQMHSDNNAEMLKFNAKLLSDIDALKEQNNAYAMLTKSQDSRLSEYYAKSQQYKDAVATLDSEKEANAILTQERDALAMQVAQMRDALEDMSSGWVYIRETHGDLYGVGWDRAQEKSRMALALPDLSAEIIKRHDAAIREEMLDMFRLKHRDYANEIAAELEKS